MGQQQSTAAPASSSAAEGSGESVSQQNQQALLCLLQAHLVHDCRSRQMMVPSQSQLIFMQSGVGVKLFKFQQNAAGGQWELYSANADTNFYDINEDSASKKKDWHLEIGSDIDLPVTDQFSVDAVGQRVTLAADSGAVYALKFPSTAAVQLFEQEYNSRLFENTFGVPFNAKNRDEVIVRLCLHRKTLLDMGCCISLYFNALICIWHGNCACVSS